MKQYVNAIKNGNEMLFMLYTFEDEKNMIKKIHAFYKENEKNYIIGLGNDFKSNVIDYTYLENKLNQDAIRVLKCDITITRFEFEQPYSNLTKQLDEMLDLTKRMTASDEWERMKIL